MKTTNILTLSKGDLIHVPQSAILYGVGTRAAIYVNQKPTLAIFLNHTEGNMSEIVMNGQNWLVRNKEIYLSKEAS